MGTIINNILAILGLLILGGLGFYLFVLDGSATLSSDTLSRTDAELKNQQFLRQIAELRSNDLSGDIFSDDRFTSLVDFTLPVRQSEVGRDNPFEQTAN